MNRIASSVFEVGKNISGNSEQLTGTVQAVTVKVSQNGDWKEVCTYGDYHETDTKIKKKHLVYFS